MRGSKSKRKYKEGTIAHLRNKQRVMRLNHFLSSNYILAIWGISISIIMFLMGSYLINLFYNIPLIIRNLDNPIQYLSLKNLIPKGSVIKSDVGLILYIVMLIIVLILNFIYLYKIKMSLSSDYFNVGQKGEQRWTTLSEIKEQYKEIPYNEKSYNGRGGTIIARIKDKFYIDDSIVNNLIIGMTRSGKGETYVLPSLDVYSRAEIKSSLIITDPKLELYKCSKETLEKRGYDVYLLNLDNPLRSMGFNPLQIVIESYKKKDYANAEMLANSFAFSIFSADNDKSTDPFWAETASLLLVALIIAHTDDCINADVRLNDTRYKFWKSKINAFKELSEEQKIEAKKLYESSSQANVDLIMDENIRYIPENVEFTYINPNEKKINMYSIINTFQSLAREKNGEDDLSLLDMYFNSRPGMDRAKLKYGGIELGGGKIKGSIFVTMLNKLSIFTYENIAKMTAESSINMEDVGFGENPVAIFLGIPDYDRSTYFIASIFIRQLYFILAKKATNIRSGKCERAVKFICDEFGNLPTIDSMETIITVCLGRNISFDMYIQGYSQLDKWYGEQAKTITGNCGNQIYILTNETTTAEHFSKLLGNETVIDVTRTGSKLSTNKQFTESLTEKPLKDPNVLMNLQMGECIIKRSMKRSDIKNRKITAFPIYNNIMEDTHYLYRYEYLSKDFPNPDEIYLPDVNKENRNFIDLDERVWDPYESLAYYENFEQKEDSILILEKVKNIDSIWNILEDKLGTDFSEKYGINKKTTIPVFIDFINKNVMIKEQDKLTLTSLIKMGA